MSVDSLDEVEVAGAIGQGARRLWRPSLSLVLAWRNLAQDRMRMLAMLAGVSFSVLLMSLQIALLLGFATTASSLIDRADADFWVASPGARDVDQSGEIAARRRFVALAVPGVSAAEELVVRFLPWKRSDGGLEQIIVVGIDLERLGLRPWNIVSGAITDLKKADGIIIDRLYAKKLGIRAIGDTAEINGRRARVVGFTEGVRTFTQAPYVFTSLRNAKAYAHIDDGNTTYLLVRTQPGADKAAVEKALRARFAGFDVWPSDEFSAQTRSYWLLSTGAGIALVVAAGLGVIVGTITVALTLYAAAMERLSEYATLRAMGAPTRYIHSVILKQAWLSAAAGYVVGFGAALAIISMARDSSLALLLPLPVALGIGLITVAMCSGAAIIAIRRAVRVQPAMVFR
jgi:putative ABC transport system permease protein